MNVTIESHSGFCSGVKTAIKRAEEVLLQNGTLYCLGEIVHNKAELERLVALGMIVIDHEKFKCQKDTSVLLRAHGEPPETYKTGKKNNITFIDASCPIVQRLQAKIRDDYANSVNSGAQIVIYGKKGHAEVIGLSGQTSYKAIVVETKEDLLKIDVLRPVKLYAQTTMGSEVFVQIADTLRVLMYQANPGNPAELEVNNTICKQVSRLVPHFQDFAKVHQIIIFVSGKTSSNGKYLCGICKQSNTSTYPVSGIIDLKSEWFEGISDVGICGATSTPDWLLQEIAIYIENNF